ncbi:hypothetical protein [Deinococcus misasensis]|uniref:hypothetical protein n=1 Tax=Deinococcus misasensis TaxID=392413 RepID=UPI0005526820|nr:hypothetical protein [Deinococcus misasensis]
MKPLQPEIHFSEAFTAIRTAERLLAEARFYTVSEPALATKLLRSAREELRHVLSFAQDGHQDTARIERAIQEIEKMGNMRPTLA